MSRVHYYNQLQEHRPLLDSPVRISENVRPARLKVYYDSQEYLRYFDGHLQFQLIPGDVTTIHIRRVW